MTATTTPAINASSALSSSAAARAAAASSSSRPATWSRVALLEKLAGASPPQTHLLRFWEELAEPARQRLARQIAALDLPAVLDLFRQGADQAQWAELARRATPAPAIALGDSHPSFTRRQAQERGEAALRAGELGFVLVAGGQGTRLGFELPKGVFPLGPVSKRSLLQMLVETLRAVRQRYNARIPLYVMTSHATHDATAAFLAEHRWFGLPQEDARLFQQAAMPAVDAATGHLLLAAKDELFLSPDGHGGMLAAFESSGCLADAEQRGLKQLFYGQVDNPLTPVCDPAAIGYHLLADSEMTTLAARKVDPAEKVGVAAQIDGRVCVLEYSDLPADVAARRDAHGALTLWAGNTAVHVLSVAFLRRMVLAGDALPFHRAKKKTPFLNAAGEAVAPSEPNAIKFERFIFDLMPRARNPLVVEIDKREAFAPVKNSDADPTDNPRTARAAMIALHRAWLASAGARVDNGTPVEISPLYALDAAELAERLPPGLRVTGPTYFAPTHAPESLSPTAPAAANVAAAPDASSP